jgi:hypothetical protein
MTHNQLKIFGSTIVGSLIGGILAVAATYGTEPRDPAFYLSLSDYFLISAVISLIASLVFYFFYKVFRVTNKNLFVIGVVAAVPQAATYLALPILPIDLGIIGAGAALLTFSAVANYVLERLGKWEATGKR